MKHILQRVLSRQAGVVLLTLFALVMGAGTAKAQDYLKIIIDNENNSYEINEPGQIPVLLSAGQHSITF